MNIIKKISISGDVFAEYAYLSFDFLFENQTSNNKNQYIFRLPKGACISNMMLAYSDDKQNSSITIKPKVVAVSHLSSLENLNEIVCLTRISEDEFAFSTKSSAKHFRLILNVYTPLELFSEKKRLNIPFSQNAHIPDADIDIIIRDAAINEIFSYSHNILCTEMQNGINIKADFSAASDLNIEINDSRRINSAIISSDGLKGQMLCRLFPSDDFFDKNNLQENADDVSVISPDGNGKGMVIKYPKRKGDSLDVIFELCGSGITPMLQVKRKDYVEDFVISNNEIYKSFAPIRLLYAEKAFRELAQELERCSPDEVRKIKRNMERIGLKYSALNTETAFVAELGNNNYGLIRTDSIASSNTQSLFDGNSDMLSSFGETQAALDRHIRTLITLMHSDGAICSNNEHRKDARVLQTLLAVLTLIAAKKAEPNSDFVRSAKAYINGGKIYGLKFTAEPGTAIVLLRNFINTNTDLPFASSEFYSAIKAICLSVM